MKSAREIFNDCCNEIAKSLAEDGFQYRPSKHSAIRADGDLTVEIHFQSSFRNYVLPDANVSKLKQRIAKLVPFGDLATYGSVTLIEHASVRSKALKNFRKSLTKAWTTEDAVTGDQIGNLQSPAKWVEFNLANPYTRNEVIAEALRLIGGVALPYFKLFQNSTEVIARLLDGSMPWTWEASALEYVCCFGKTDDAKQLLERFVNESPGRAAEFREVLRRYRSDGTPEAWESKVSARLAKAAIILGLDSSIGDSV
jgi:hypothetical protein